jgi:tetratricopeptide (TPR) repeat protein
VSARRVWLGAALIVAVSAGCRSTEPDPRYRATEGVLEVVAVLRVHIDDDTYRFRPARDFTGKNVYRSVLERLESLEAIHEAKFRSGYVLDVLLFSKGRALERIGEFELAAQHYLRVTDLESPLVEPARRSRDVCLRLSDARRERPDTNASAGEALEVFDRREERLQELLVEVEGTHYVPVVREEVERADAERARWFRAKLLLDPEMEPLAMAEYKRFVDRNRESKLRSRHLLELGDFYAELARAYSRRFPPVSLGFDPATFDEYALGASRLYEAVAQQDGAIEKIEAARKLEAFLAFSFEVRSATLAR